MLPSHSTIKHNAVFFFAGKVVDIYAKFDVIVSAVITHYTRCTYLQCMPRINDL